MEMAVPIGLSPLQTWNLGSGYAVQGNCSDCTIADQATYVGASSRRVPCLAPRTSLCETVERSRRCFCSCRRLQSGRIHRRVKIALAEATSVPSSRRPTANAASLESDVCSDALQLWCQSPHHLRNPERICAFSETQK